uniref:Major facilitator superfamily (MFS) profile domain-containing protein n=1 Tax=Chlamydomonas euryale TaxID=1486919 RepID=A0A7R9YR06_9CHLO
MEPPVTPPAALATAEQQRSAGYVRARAALVRAWGARATRHPVLVGEEMSAIALSAREATLSASARLRTLGHRLYYRPLAVGLLLMLFQQITGQPVVMAGSRAMLAAAGVTSRPDEVVAAFRLLVTLLTAATVDVAGRRPLLLTGASGMVTTLAVLCVMQLPVAAAMATEEQLALAGVATMAVFLACFQLSWGPISWLYCGEIFPLGIRGPAIAASNACGFSSSLAVTLLLPSLQRLLGVGGTYAACAAVCLAAVVTAHALVPETCGRSLEEIELYWGGDRMPSFETSSFSDWLP